MAAANFGVCSGRECHVTGYDVEIEQDGAGDILATLVDPCNTLNNQIVMKNVLLNAISQFLVSEGTTLDCGTPVATRCECAYPALGVFVIGDKTYTYPDPGGVTIPVSGSPDTYTVTLPFS